ncbi:MAG: Gfo/Idh/MocA family oxidoreductase, partial [Thermoleophilia bacterium]|nr:Gfo/Idh/MocA family oxidoreductase [Thermoleophilia bacterium]
SIMAAARQRGAVIAAVCDVDASHRKAAAARLAMLGQDQAPAESGDFRELLDRPDLDAVTIATPDHWHALVAIAALHRGKHVYCEKPLSLTIEEGRAIARAAKAAGTVFQTGSQQRSNQRFRLACELVRNGRIGKIATVETRIGANPEGGPFREAPVPDGFDWDTWLGPTPFVEYIPQRAHNTFRWWYEYSGGKLTDWGAHHNDIAQWGLGTDATGPVQVESTAIPPARCEPGCYNTPPHFNVTYTYGPAVTPVCDRTRIICTSGGENGIKFVGEGGWIFVSRSRIDASAPAILTEPLPDGAERLDASNDHMKNFVDAASGGGGATICPAEIGHRSATICHLGNISISLSHRTLRWDPAAERFPNDALANLMRSRPMRAPWRLDL